MEARQEKTRVLMTVAYLEHLQDRETQAIATVRDALVADPGYAFRPELYNDTFAAVFYEGQKRAAELRSRRADQAVKAGNERLSARDFAAARKHAVSCDVEFEHAGFDHIIVRGAGAAQHRLDTRNQFAR